MHAHALTHALITHIHSLSKHTLTHTHTHSHTHTHRQSHMHAHALTHTYTRTHTLTHMHPHTHRHTLCDGNLRITPSVALNRLVAFSLERHGHCKEFYSHTLNISIHAQTHTASVCDRKLTRYTVCTSSS